MMKFRKTFKELKEQLIIPKKRKRKLFKNKLWFLINPLNLTEVCLII